MVIADNTWKELWIQGNRRQDVRGREGFLSNALPAAGTKPGKGEGVMTTPGVVAMRRCSFPWLGNSDVPKLSGFK